MLKLAVPIQISLRFLSLTLALLHSSAPCPQCSTLSILTLILPSAFIPPPFLPLRGALPYCTVFFGLFILSLVFVLGSIFTYLPLRTFVSVRPLYLLTSSSSTLLLLTLHSSCISREPESSFLSSLHWLCYLPSAPCLARHLSFNLR